MKYEEYTIGKFVDELASDLPAPGGGSVAALCGALAAGLNVMVGSLTVGKEKYRDKWEIMESITKDSNELRAEFVRLMNEDTESFNKYMAALRMPRGTDAEKAARKAAMAEAAKGATDVPLRTLEACEKTAALALVAAENGNINAASDAGCAALIADAAAKAASFNVRINLPGIKDEAFAADVRWRMERALAETAEYAAKTSKKMNEILR